MATGYDISGHAVAEAKRRHEGTEFHHGRLEDSSDCYDVGLMVDILEHLEDPGAFLGNARRRFVSLILHVPFDETYFNQVRYGRTCGRFFVEDYGHSHLFTKRLTLALLRSAGLRLERQKRTPWGLELYRRLCAGRSAPVIRVLRAAGMCFCPDVCVRVLGGASLAVLCTADVARDKG